MPEPKPVDQVTRREFRAYERIRRSGKYNMMTHGAMARSDARISKAAYSAILQNYLALLQKWPEVRAWPNVKGRHD